MVSEISVKSRYISRQYGRLKSLISNISVEDAIVFGTRIPLLSSDQKSCPQGDHSAKLHKNTLSDDSATILTF